MTFYISCVNCLEGRGRRGALAFMKFNDGYDSEQHMEQIGKYMAGRKGKVFFIC